MRFNRIINTIFKLRKIAAGTTEFQDHMKNYRELTNKLQNHEYIDPADLQKLQDFDKYLEQHYSDYTVDNAPTIFDDESDILPSEFERVIDSKELPNRNDKTDDKYRENKLLISNQVKLLIENPLFPGDIKTLIKENRFSNARIKKLIASHESELEKMQSQYDDYIDYINDINNKISIYTQYQHKLEAKFAESDNASQEKEALIEKVKALDIENKELEQALNEVETIGEDDYSGYDKASALQDYQGADKLLRIGGKLDAYTDNIKDLQSEKKDLEKELDDKRTGLKEKIRIERRLEEIGVKIQQLALQRQIAKAIQDTAKINEGKDEADKEWIVDYSEILELNKSYRETYGEFLLNAQTNVENAPWDILNTYIRNWIGCRKKLRKLNNNKNEKEHIEQTIIKITNRVPEIDKDIKKIQNMLDRIQRLYEEAEEEKNSEKFRNAQEYIDDYNRQQIQLTLCKRVFALLSKRYTKNSLNADIDMLYSTIEKPELQQFVSNIQKELNIPKRKTKDDKIKFIKETISEISIDSNMPREEKKERLDLLLKIREYIEQERYVPDIEQNLEELKDKIDNLARYMRDNAGAYEAALSHKNSMNLQELSFTKEYEKQRKALENARKEYIRINRTNTQLLEAVDTELVDTKAISDKIIKYVTAQGSLLGILLTESIDKFVVQYLKNNKYITPNMQHKIYLLHYYISDDKKELEEKNIRIQDLESFQDAEENMILLQNMVKPLIQETKDNIVIQFFKILKSDYPDIYDAYDLNPILNRDRIYFTKYNDGDIEGPYTLAELRDPFPKELKEQVKEGFRFRDRKDSNKIGEIIKRPPTGYELLNVLDTASEDRNNIKKLFKSVEDHIINNIRERLQKSAYNICINRGDAFYGILLSNILNDDIGTAVKDKLDEFIRPKNIKSKYLGEQMILEHIEFLKSNIIKELCNKFDTNNEYVMFVKFLQIYDVYDPNMEQRADEMDNEYQKRLETTYHKPFSIFKETLTSMIKKKIKMSLAEKKIRNPLEYKEFKKNAETVDNKTLYYEKLNGFTDKDGNFNPGLSTQLRVSKKEVTNNFNSIKQHLLNAMLKNNNIQSLEYEDKEEKINAIIESEEPLITNLLYASEEKIIQFIKERAEKYNNAAKSKSENTQSLMRIFMQYVIGSSLRQIFAQEDVKKLIDEYKTNVVIRDNTQKDYDEISTYLRIYDGKDSTNTSYNAIISELKKIYTDLYGKENNPIIKRIEWQKDNANIEQLEMEDREIEDELKELNKRLPTATSDQKKQIQERINKITKKQKEIKQRKSSIEDKNTSYSKLQSEWDILENLKNGLTSTTAPQRGLYGKLLYCKQQVIDLKENSQLTEESRNIQLKNMNAQMERIRAEIRQRVQRLAAIQYTAFDLLNNNNEVSSNIMDKLEQDPDPDSMQEKQIDAAIDKEIEQGFQSILEVTENILYANDVEEKKAEDESANNGPSGFTDDYDYEDDEEDKEDKEDKEVSIAQDLDETIPYETRYNEQSEKDYKNKMDNIDEEWHESSQSEQAMGTRFYQEGREFYQHPESGTEEERMKAQMEFYLENTDQVLGNINSKQLRNVATWLIQGIKDFTITAKTFRDWMNTYGNNCNIVFESFIENIPKFEKQFSQAFTKCIALYNNLKNLRDKPDWLQNIYDEYESNK